MHENVIIMFCLFLRT